MMALIANVNKDKGRSFDPVDFHPYKKRVKIITGFPRESYKSMLAAFVKPENRLCHEQTLKQDEQA